jgi:hypothetical protein
MKECDYKYLLDRYNDYFSQHGYSRKSVGWGKDNQYIRFKALTEDFNLVNSSILDYGCGFCDLYYYLEDNNIKCQYYGADINKKFLKEVEKTNNHINTKLIDPYSKLTRKYDFIISSGILNTKISHYQDFLDEILELLFNYSNKGFSINFLSDRSDIKIKDLYYNNPSNILNKALKYSNCVKLKHDYMPYEFSLIVYKGMSIDVNTNKYIFEE